MAFRPHLNTLPPAYRSFADDSYGEAAGRAALGVAGALGSAVLNSATAATASHAAGRLIEYAAPSLSRDGVTRATQHAGIRSFSRSLGGSVNRSIRSLLSSATMPSRKRARSARTRRGRRRRRTGQKNRGYASVDRSGMAMSAADVPNFGPGLSSVSLGQVGPYRQRPNLEVVHTRASWTTELILPTTSPYAATNGFASMSIYANYPGGSTVSVPNRGIDEGFDRFQNAAVIAAKVSVTPESQKYNGHLNYFTDSNLITVLQLRDSALPATVHDNAVADNIGQLYALDNATKISHAPPAPGHVLANQDHAIEPPRFNVGPVYSCAEFYGVNPLDDSQQHCVAPSGGTAPPTQSAVWTCYVGHFKEDASADYRVRVRVVVEQDVVFFNRKSA